MRLALLAGQERQVFRGVARCVLDLEDESAQFKAVAIADLDRIEAINGPAFGAEIDRGRRLAAGQFTGAAEEISVNMGFENVGDGDPVTLREVEIDIHIGAGINDRRRTGVVVADQIGELAGAGGVDLFEDEAHRFSVDQTHRRHQALEGPMAASATLVRPRSLTGAGGFDGEVVANLAHAHHLRGDFASPADLVLVVNETAERNDAFVGIDIHL